jgi:hypothetical protein
VLRPTLPKGVPNFNAAPAPEEIRQKRVAQLPKDTLTPEDAAIHPEIQTSTPGDRSVPFSGPVSANVERPRHHQGARYERNRRAS